MPEKQSKHWGSDWRGNEVLEGDQIVHDPQLDEVFLMGDLFKYLKEKYGFEFMKAE
ncbi:hypothetical protein QNH23_06260 [Siminovitchia fortis]|uniref:Uncharacterized protein n=1 Tax=Siminovitchia fortis TaxID=254758 RepID=A0A443IMV1_9BACI|nr:hypothetical protein [Siminovitchia fortis]RWR06710.1 hypothetical protein D4N35_013670 [Siminovitchia fortis]WHY82974.1 hypothetical protein QNH23_06260 [Siminovitchia fortis]